MYRFLLTPRWIGGALLALAAAATMVLLGNWQLSRYHERSAFNARVDAGARATPVDVTAAMTPPTTVGTPGPGPSATAVWSRVSAAGHYDAPHEILARERTVENTVGYEVITPLLLDNGTAVLVDRGFVPPAQGGAMPEPKVPPAPTGPVTVVGLVHPSESHPDPILRRDGTVQVRRISVGQLARQLPYPVFGGYVLLTEQRPAADPAFTPVPVDHENALMNGGYTLQWWAFAVMALAAYGWLVWREAHPAPARDDGPDRPRDGPGGPAPEAGTPPIRVDGVTSG